MSQHYIPVREDWLAARREEILDPGQRIVDPHHHLWERPGWRYRLDDILADIRTGHDVYATVLVQARAFHRYARLSARPTAGESSTGLGLNIAKRLTESMSGRLTLETSGGGGLVTVTLPAA